ncbi:alpha/beta hydrolase [Candidatus Thorarchaeota archaeon]|nr:MAG: alpha/beta hydrolase [Candidatus Thorarchaeota archaeon]
MKVHVEKSGDKTALPIIFIHGAGGSAATWIMQLRGLTDEFHVIAIELNGHGKSPDRKGYDVTNSYLEDIDQIVNDYSNPILAGHSMGGMLTQLYALQNSKKIRGIILVGTGAKLRVMPSIFEMLENDFENYVQAVGNFMFHEGASPEMIEASKVEVRKGRPEIISRDFRACDNFDIMDQVSEIATPTLIIVGRDDLMTPIKYSQYLHDQIKDSTLKIIESAGHSVMLEQSRAFNNAVKEWLKQL